MFCARSLGMATRCSSLAPLITLHGSPARFRCPPARRAVRAWARRRGRWGEQVASQGCDLEPAPSTLALPPAAVLVAREMHSPEQDRQVWVREYRRDLDQHHDETAVLAAIGEIGGCKGADGQHPPSLLAPTVVARPVRHQTDHLLAFAMIP